ncbi:MAG TPA: hypothetical protein VNK41_02065 [Vicinamibacterales bacterium]|nr:hypothetical protein [Vicinamibacterales bacterium]
MRRLEVLTAILLAPFAAGCGASSPASPSPVPISELSSAPTQISAGGATLKLDASLWRDFMPISPPDGKPLSVVARMTTTDGSRVPESLRVEKLFVVHGGEAWETHVEERPRNQTAPAYELTARNGPKWGPGVKVDVIVRVVDSDGRTSLLRVPDREIAATH